MRLILLGPPGAGKGTQGRSLAAHYGVPHVATGAIVRDHIARRTEFGQRVEAAIALGDFAPDADIVYWVGRRLLEPDARIGYVLDGFPRDLAQAKVWDTLAASEGKALDAVIELMVSETALIERLSGRLVCPVDGETYHLVHHPPQIAGRCDHDGAVLERRPDDKPNAIRHRLKVYEGATLPLRDYYRAQGVLHSVDADGDAEHVTQTILGVLGS